MSKNRLESKLFYNTKGLTVDEKFDIIDKHIADAREAMNGLFHNSAIHVDYIVELRDQIRSLGGDPLPYPDDILDEYIGD